MAGNNAESVRCVCVAGAAELREWAQGSVPDNSWLLLAVFEAGDDARRLAGRASFTIAGLRERGARLLWVVHPDDRAAFTASAARLTTEACNASSALTVLVPRRPPPVHDFRRDGTVSSFGCTLDVCADLGLSLQPRNLPAACYRVVAAAARGTCLPRQFLVRHIPADDRAEPLPGSAPAEVLIAHRGERHFLETTLHYLRTQLCRPAAVRIGLDGERPADYADIRSAHPDVRFYRVMPSPAGLYVIRTGLARIAEAPLLMWQDSDDVSTSDRTGVLQRELERTACDYLGSHELRVDEFNRCVEALRFPLDVNAALKHVAGHSLYDASAMIRRTAFHAAGGYSTIRRFASDSQFLLRAFFHARMRNVDRFLYVRRKRRGSLTTSRQTGAGSAPRLELDRKWKQDFERVRDGRLCLEDSALAVEQTPVTHALRAL